MGNFDLRLGQARPASPNLGNFRLQLDPAIEAEMRALEAMIRDGQLQRAWLTPNWALFQESQLDRMLRQTPPVPPQRPVLPRDAEEPRPRPGKTKDVLENLWRIPAVRSGVTRVLTDIGNRLRMQWNSASTAQQVAAVSHTVLLAGSALTLLYRDPEARQVLANIENTDIPVPGADGLTFRLAPQGGAVGYAPPAVPGLAARGGFRVNDAGASRPVDYNVMVTFDIAVWLRNR